jgi:hypothetical protein
MHPRQWLAVTSGQALRFFFERLKDVSDEAGPPVGELLYNASVLAHFASTSTAASTGLPTPNTLADVFDRFVIDTSFRDDPELLELAGGQILLLTGFFADQLKSRFNLNWYGELGAGFYGTCALLSRSPAHREMMLHMAGRFEYWRSSHLKLSRELRDLPYLGLFRAS